jgi:hypothetical protein
VIYGSVCSGIEAASVAWHPLGWRVAERAGFLSSVVRRIVKAHAGEKFEEEKRKVDQLGIVFEEVGAENKGNYILDLQ